MNLVLAVTTYNRKDRLENLINSFFATRSDFHRWRVIIADDGSTDETIPYLNSLNASRENIFIIRNQRKGVHHQFNTLLKAIEKTQFDYCFKCDDDIEFIQKGWEDHYIRAIQESGYDHLCFFDPNWRPEKNMNSPVEKGSLISHCIGKDVQGAFFTLTPKVIEKVGYMDVENFGFRGVGHIDYTLRACRMGFNDLNNPFDAKGSGKYIRYQFDNYSSAMPEVLVKVFEDEADSKRKYDLINEPRTYVPFREMLQSIDTAMEKQLLLKRIETLENEKKTAEAEKLWYESELKSYKSILNKVESEINWYKSEIITIKQWSAAEVEKNNTWHKSFYSHLPDWYLKLGKIFKLRKKS